MEEPIIIGGSPRSGTTLLRAMLDAHRSIAIGPETSLLSGDYSLRRVARFYGENPWRLAAERQLLPPRTFVRRFFARQARKAGKARWGEKSPENVRHLPRIFAWFPDAVFVHVIRDGRDVACSLRTHPKAIEVDGVRVPVETDNPISVCISQWVVDVHAGLGHRGDPRYVEVRYEDLVSRPRETMEALLARLGEPFDEAVLAHHVKQRDASTIGSTPRAAEKLTRSRVGRWRRDLSPRELDVVNAVAGDLLDDLGYREAPDRGGAGEPRRE